MEHETCKLDSWYSVDIVWGATDFDKSLCMVKKGGIFEYFGSISAFLSSKLRNFEIDWLNVHHTMQDRQPS